MKQPDKEFDNKSRDKNDLLLLRAKKPLWKKYTQSYVHDFDGRVKENSKKNVQIEYKSRVDNRCRIVLQHGKMQVMKNKDEQGGGKLYSLDFTYPFSPI